MDIEDFLCQKLKTIKKKINIDIINQKIDGDNILQLLFYQSLSKIKFIFEYCYLNQKSLFLEKDENTILHIVSTYEFAKIKYVFDFCEVKIPSLILEKNDVAATFLHCLFGSNSSKKAIKYGLKICKKYPSLILEKTNFGDTIFSIINSKLCSLTIAKYHFKFFIYRCPFLFLEDLNEEIMSSYYMKFDYPVNRYIVKFCSYNFPEISLRTNNFILPLLMEIQN